MTKKLLLLFIIPTLSYGNELNTQTWNFPTPDESIVASGKVQSFCAANPDKCPAGLNQSLSGGKGRNSGSLFDPTTSSSANQTSVTLVGDGNSVVLTTSQSSENDQISSDSENDAEIDYQEVLNYSK